MSNEKKGEPRIIKIPGGRLPANSALREPSTEISPKAKLAGSVFTIAGERHVLEPKEPIPGLHPDIYEEAQYVNQRTGKHVGEILPGNIPYPESINSAVTVGSILSIFETGDSDLITKTKKLIVEYLPAEMHGLAASDQAELDKAVKKILKTPWKTWTPPEQQTVSIPPKGGDSPLPLLERPEREKEYRSLSPEVRNILFPRRLTLYQNGVVIPEELIIAEALRIQQKEPGTEGIYFDGHTLREGETASGIASTINANFVLHSGLANDRQKDDFLREMVGDGKVDKNESVLGIPHHITNTYEKFAELVESKNYGGLNVFFGDKKVLAELALNDLLNRLNSKNPNRILARFNGGDDPLNLYSFVGVLPEISGKSESEICPINAIGQNHIGLEVVSGPNGKGKSTLVQTQELAAKKLPIAVVKDGSSEASFLGDENLFGFGGDSVSKDPLSTGQKGIFGLLKAQIRVSNGQLVQIHDEQLGISPVELAALQAAVAKEIEESGGKLIVVSQNAFLLNEAAMAAGINNINHSCTTGKYGEWQTGRMVESSNGVLLTEALAMDPIFLEMVEKVSIELGCPVGISPDGLHAAQRRSALETDLPPLAIDTSFGTTLSKFYGNIKIRQFAQQLKQGKRGIFSDLDHLLQYALDKKMTDLTAEKLIIDQEQIARWGETEPEVLIHSLALTVLIEGNYPMSHLLINRLKEVVLSPAFSSEQQQALSRFVIKALEVFESDVASHIPKISQTVQIEAKRKLEEVSLKEFLMGYYKGRHDVKFLPVVVDTLVEKVNKYKPILESPTRIKPKENFNKIAELFFANDFFDSTSMSRATPVIANLNREFSGTSADDLFCLNNPNITKTYFRIIHEYVQKIGNLNLSSEVADFCDNIVDCFKDEPLKHGLIFEDVTFDQAKCLVESMVNYYIFNISTVRRDDLVTFANRAKRDLAPASSYLMKKLSARSWEMPTPDNLIYRAFRPVPYDVQEAYDEYRLFKEKGFKYSNVEILRRFFADKLDWYANPEDKINQLVNTVQMSRSAKKVNLLDAFWGNALKPADKTPVLFSEMVETVPSEFFSIYLNSELSECLSDVRDALANNDKRVFAAKYGLYCWAVELFGFSDKELCFVEDGQLGVKNAFSTLSMCDQVMSSPDDELPENSLKRVKKGFRKFNAQFGTGDYQGLFGENGAGKSTLLKLIATEAGEAQVLGLKVPGQIYIPKGTKIVTLDTYQTDIAGASTFTAKLAQARTLMDVLKNDSKTAPIIVLSDEMFEGTGRTAQHVLSLAFRRWVEQLNRNRPSNAKIFVHTVTHDPTRSGLSKEETIGVLSGKDGMLTQTPVSEAVRIPQILSTLKKLKAPKRIIDLFQDTYSKLISSNQN